LRLRTLKKIKHTIKESTNKAHKGITLQCQELQYFSTQPKRLNALTTWLYIHYDSCTDQVIGFDDVAASDNIGVLNGTPGRQKGSTSGNQYSRQSLKWRSPISSVRNRRSRELRHSRRV